MTDRRDPFEDLAQPVELQQPRPSFARDLRARIARELGVAPDPDRLLDLPRRSPVTSTSATTPATTRRPAATLTPYLAVRGGPAAIDWYVEVLGAVEVLRVVGDDGRVGHAELTIGGARFMLADEHPEIGVHGPASLGGTSATLHLEVTDVDGLYARAVAAGASPRHEPADQPHGARDGTLIDPFGHRWMLSQQIERVDLATYAERAAGSGYTVEPGAPSHGARSGDIWAGVSYRDALAGIRFLVDVLGFEEQTVFTDPDDPSVVVHSELRWPEGGVLQAGTYVPGNEFMQAPGAQAVYVITADPAAVFARCEAAGVEVVRPLEEPHYDPGGIGFSIRDPEGNLFSFGTYAGAA